MFNVNFAGKYVEGKPFGAKSHNANSDKIETFGTVYLNSTGIITTNNGIPIN